MGSAEHDVTDFMMSHFLELALCRRFFTLPACLFPSMDHQARTCVTSCTPGVEILIEMGGGEQAKCLPWP